MPILVKRGDTVTITTSNPNLAIAMQGTALMDGAQGQRIRVKNTTSNRVISGVVTKAGVVSVDF
jgi:flagella basal body P-ring formation protein FlgA